MATALHISLFENSNFDGVYEMFKKIFLGKPQTNFNQPNIIKFNECALKLKYLDNKTIKELYIKKDIADIGIEYDFDINSFRYVIRCVDENNTKNLTIDQITRIYKQYLKIEF